MTEERAENYVVAGSRSWSRRVFEERISRFPGRWLLVSTPAELETLDLASLRPRYLFFTHWSWKVPAEIVRSHECVCFQMTDLPYGRGGSPLQNLIIRGHRTTKLTALRMVDELDAGPVYTKEDLSLGGSAEEIYRRAADLVADFIARMIREPLTPVPRQGKSVVFRRRKPAESRLPEAASLSELHDFIRMLDAEGFPKAFLEVGDLRLEFSRADLHEGSLETRVTMTRRQET